MVSAMPPVMCKIRVHALPLKCLSRVAGTVEHEGPPSYDPALAQQAAPIHDCQTRTYLSGTAYHSCRTTVQFSSDVTKWVVQYSQH